jgi:hypothetical protein
MSMVAIPGQLDGTNPIGPTREHRARISCLGATSAAWQRTATISEDARPDSKGFHDPVAALL